jgi:hypothetical protein
MERLRAAKEELWLKKTRGATIDQRWCRSNAIRPSFRPQQGKRVATVKPMHFAILGLALLLGDHFLFNGQYREVVWSELKSAGDSLNAQMARLSPMFGR